MTRLQIRTRILATAVALLLMPAFAHAEGDELTKKDAAPAGRQRLNPRTAEGSQLSGVPADTAIAAAPTLHGFGPMGGNPLFGAAMPLKSGN
jgi:hypothetical protein